MISIKDIARDAGVSHSTVSRALRNSPLVNAKTAALVRRIAKKHKYVASAVARSLVMRRTNTIGVVVTSIADLSPVKSSAGWRNAPWPITIPSYSWLHMATPIESFEPSSPFTSAGKALS